ncbi:PGM2 (predicted) [Pycnogonum litorale]
MSNGKIDTGSLELDDKINQWLEWDQNEETKSEILKLVENKQHEDLKKRMLSRMLFGTAGLRGMMQAGYLYMNDLVIIQTAQGLVSYMLEVCPDVTNKGVVIGYDARYNSSRFAELSAVALISKEIPVYMFSKIVPTPYVPYTVLQYGCCAGIMVTASHNPKQDNGYKVYWSNGAQIISPHDQGIQKNIEDHLAPWDEAWNVDLCKTSKLCKDPLAEINDKYMESLSKLAIDKSLNAECKVKFTFTPVHGVGYSYIQQAFEAFNFPPCIPVKEQIVPDPDFPTVTFPNPEEGKSTLDLSFKTADENDSKVILANDPDSDRLAVAIKLETGWKVFSGNEIGGLLGWWMWHSFRLKNPDANVSDVYMICSTVSSKILKAIAEKEGFNFIETLTGFKWMGNKSVELIKQGKTVLMAFEEAIGYMCGTRVLDKDGITAAVMVAEMVTHLDKNKISLYDQLQNVYKMYGYHSSLNSYFLCYCSQTIEKIFARLRNYNGPDTYPEKLGEFKIESLRDLTTGYDSSTPDNKPLLPSSSASQMITFKFENGCEATLRTSGTEPKIKYYSELCGRIGMDNWAELDETLQKLVSHLVDEWLQPKINDLTPKPE